MEPFISSDDLAAYLGETVDGFELITQIALDAACQLVRDDLEQTVNLVRDDLETYDGHGRYTLILRQLPVIQVTVVEEDGELLVEGEDEDYTVDTRTGVIHRRSSDLTWLGWMQGRQNVTVTYDHGWAIEEADVVEPGSGDEPPVSRVPSSIRLVALELAASIFKAPTLTAVTVGGVTEKTIGSATVKYDQSLAEAKASVSVSDDQHHRLDKKRPGNL